MVVRFSVEGRHFWARLFIFDKDGTLISFDHWGEVMQIRAHRLAQRLSLAEREAASLLRFMGVEPETGVVLLNGIIPLPRTDAEAAVAQWLTRELNLPQPEAVTSVSEVFQEVDNEFPFERYIRPTPGAEGVLLGIRRSRGKTAVVTHDTVNASRRHFGALGWNELIDIIVGTDTCSERKPSPCPILAACSTLRESPTDGVMVGDTQSDLWAGRHAGCRLTIGVLTGLGRAEELANVADVVLSNLTALKIL